MDVYSRELMCVCVRERERERDRVARCHKEKDNS